MGNQTIHVGSCPTCGALAQAIAEGDGTVYRHIDLDTLRQQAGRVDEGMEVIINDLRHSAMVDGYTEDQERFVLSIAERIENTAALAQNTQGEAVAIVSMTAARRPYGVPAINWLMTADAKAIKPGTPLYLHAERARVPDGWVLVPREPTPEMAASFGYMATRGFHACYESMLSTATSQRAEVK